MDTSARTPVLRRAMVVAGLTRWNVYDQAGTLLGWVVGSTAEGWRAYALMRYRADEARRVGWDFSKRREAVDEVLIQTER